MNDISVVVQDGIQEVYSWYSQEMVWWKSK